VLEKIGLPAEAPFFLAVLDKDRSFRWFHTVLAGFECFNDIREADTEEPQPMEEHQVADDVPPPSLSEQSSPTYLVITGLSLADFPTYQKLLQEALPQKLQERVLLQGNVSASLLRTLYVTAKGLLYLPSERELGLGLSVLEALVMQCPVVTTKVGHLEEWSQKASLLLEPHEPLQVAFAMAQLMDEPQLIEALRHNGRKRSLLSGVENFTQQLMTILGGVSSNNNLSKPPFYSSSSASDTLIHR
jgi:glycosyltransferase involved in cell wall biosynthesis